MRGVNRAVIFAAGYGVNEPDGLDWAALARTGQPLVLYMAMANLGMIAEALMQGGCAPHTPAAVIAGATTAQERILVSTLERVAADVRDGRFEPPAIVVIGDIVAARDKIIDMANAANSQVSP
jgi:uroporphyrin-III C-methyltransferase